MMDYLNQDHPLLRSSPAAYSSAARILLNSVLKHSRSFRIQFDRDGLEKVIGSAELSRVMPGLTSHKATPGPASAYDIHEETLDADKAKALQSLLSFGMGDWREMPLNYIRSISLLDEHGQMIFHGSDTNNFQIFRLPEDERLALLKAYAQEGIPPEVIEPVDVNPEQLYP
jgi:hypothetical protein